MNSKLSRNPRLTFPLGCLLIILPFGNANASIDLGDAVPNAPIPASMAPSVSPVFPSNFTNAISTNKIPAGVVTKTSVAQVSAMPTNAIRQKLGGEEFNSFASLEGLDKQSDFKGAVHFPLPIDGKVVTEVPASQLQIKAPLPLVISDPALIKIDGD